MTDLGVYEPDAATGELVLTQLQPGSDVTGARTATGWDLSVSDSVVQIAAPDVDELERLRALTGTRGGRSHRAG